MKRIFTNPYIILYFKRAFHFRKNIEMLYNREVHVLTFKVFF